MNKQFLVVAVGLLCSCQDKPGISDPGHECRQLVQASTPLTLSHVSTYGHKKGAIKAVFELPGGEQVSYECFLTMDGYLDRSLTLRALRDQGGD